MESPIIWFKRNSPTSWQIVFCIGEHECNIFFTWLFSWCKQWPLTLLLTYYVTVNWVNFHRKMKSLKYMLMRLSRKMSTWREKMTDWGICLLILVNRSVQQSTFIHFPYLVVNLRLTALWFINFLSLLTFNLVINYEL